MTASSKGLDPTSLRARAAALRRSIDRAENRLGERDAVHAKAEQLESQASYLEEQDRQRAAEETARAAEREARELARVRAALAPFLAPDVVATTHGPEGNLTLSLEGISLDICAVGDDHTYLSIGGA